MSCRLAALVFDASDPHRLAAFWAGVLGRDVETRSDPDLVTLLPRGPHDFPIDFAPTDAPRQGPNRTHFDLTSASPDDQQAIVERALSLGASHLDIGQGPDAAHVVLADPDGNEFCVIPPDNQFLSNTAPIGALSGDGTQAVGYFWAAALNWPLVWDQDEETAIQAPDGGTKFTWGGPPVEPKQGKNRLHFDVAPTDGASQHSAVERLITLGARRIDVGQGDVPWVVMADPDENEFCVLAPR